MKKNTSIKYRRRRQQKKYSPHPEDRHSLPPKCRSQSRTPSQSPYNTNPQPDAGDNTRNSSRGLGRIRGACMLLLPGMQTHVVYYSCTSRGRVGLLGQQQNILRQERV